MPAECPNCGQEVTRAHGRTQCMLAVLASVTMDREEISPEEVRRHIIQCDTDSLWDDIGAIVDKFEGGHYDR